MNSLQRSRFHSDFPAMIRGKKRLELDGGPDAVTVEVDTSSGSIKLLENEG